MDNNRTNVVLQKIKKSFNIILEMLRDRGINGLDTLCADAFEEFFNAQMNNTTFVITLNDTHKIVYNVSKKPTMKDIGEALYHGVENGENVYTHFTFIVLQERLQSKDKKKLENLKLNMQLFMLDELQYNITKHHLVPKHELIKNPDDIKKLMEELSLHSISQLPLILQTDPMARWLNAQPGDVLKITRPSESAGFYATYRCCV